ncbi:MAG: TolC family protein [Acidobacteriota bacterium]
MRYFLARSILLLGLALLTLTGCTSARLDFETAVDDLHRELPATWAGATDAAPVSTSLLEMVDDERLHDLVSEALAANPDLRAAARRLAASRSLLRETGALSWPIIEAQFNASRSRQASILTETGGLAPPGGLTDTGGLTDADGLLAAFGPLNAAPFTRHQAAVSVAWEVDIWRRLARLHDENVALTQSQAAELAAARDALGAQVIQSWLVTVSLRRAIAVEEQRVEILERLQGTIERRYRLGLGGPDDLAAARATTELSKASIAALEADLEQALRALELLLGRTPRAELTTSDTLPALSRTGTGYPAAILVQRHDVAAALWRLEAADAAAAAAAKAMLPGLRLTGDLGRDSSSLSALLSSGSVWSVIGSLTQPIFQRGLLKARTAARRLELEAAWEDYHATVLRAIAEVEDALSRERALLRQRDHLAVALAESTRNLQVFQERYRRGLASIVELLQAADQEMNARRQVIGVADQALRNRVTLTLALGAGCEEPEA